MPAPDRRCVPVSGSASAAGAGGTGPHVLVGDVDVLELSDDDRHHLERVLRLRPGDDLTAGDGAGRWRKCRFGAVLEPVGEVVVAAAPEPALAVGFSVLKGGRSEHVVQKLTELGVDRIVPFTAERSVVRWDSERADRMLERWCRVAREALMQCRRLWLPQIDPPGSFDGLDTADAALAVPGGRALAPGEHFVLIGPEGGWTDAELAAVPRHVGLGAHVLRAETAAVVAAAILGAGRSGHLP